MFLRFFCLDGVRIWYYRASSKTGALQLSYSIMRSLFECLLLLSLGCLDLYLLKFTYKVGQEFNFHSKWWRRRNWTRSLSWPPSHLFLSAVWMWRYCPPGTPTILNLLNFGFWQYFAVTKSPVSLSERNEWIWHEILYQYWSFKARRFLKEFTIFL